MHLQTTAHPVNAAGPLAPAGEVADVSLLHGQLLRYAKGQLRNEALAEDAVSETVLAALKAGPQFRDQSHARAWMFGVLRHKLVDELRQQGRELPSGDLALEPDAGSAAWMGAGCWWGDRSQADDPEQSCRQRQFLELLGRCCERLPAIQARAFIMRELRGLEAPAICGQLNVTESHLWVLLHRARLRLRTMLMHQWQLAADGSGSGS